MLTKKDIELLLEHFITRTEFEHAIQTIEEKMVTKEDNNRLYDLVDKVLVEVTTIRQEQAAHYQQHEDTNNEIKDIKKRVTKVESHVQTRHL